MTTSTSSQHSTSFQHRTTNVATSRPVIDTSLPPINTTPVELDATPTTASAREPQDQELKSPVETERMREERRGDPAVLVDIPSEPAPEQLEVAGADSEQDGGVKV